MRESGLAGFEANARRNAGASSGSASAYVDRERPQAEVREHYDWLFNYNVDKALI